jgi:subtilisin family serine protease
VTIVVAPRRPWRPEDTRHAVRGRVMVRLRDQREHVPHSGDVAIGAAAAALRLDDDSVDRVIAARSPAMRVTRPFHAARNLTAIGRRATGWNDREIALGLARTFRVDVDPDASIIDLCSALSDLDSVESASPVYLADCPFGDEPVAPDPLALGDWGHALIGSGAALALEPGDPTVIIAIIDSGVAAHHIELLGRCRAGADVVDLPEADVSSGIRLLGDHARRDRSPEDEVGHGTACAGIIAARGIQLAPGVAGAAPVLPMRALCAAQIADRSVRTALGTLPDIDVALKLAVDLGARVLNLSFGTPESALREDDPVPHAEVTEYALAQGCILVAASGNGGDTCRYLPAALPGVIAVGSIGPERRPSKFTTRGAHVALCAPGERIRTAALDGITVHNGTSFAAPFVAGACALMAAAAARRLAPLTPYTARALLVQTAQPFDDGVEHDGCGAGVLDVPAAVRAAQQLSHDFDDEAGGLSHLGRRADRPQLIQEAS